ncbi:MAG: DUF3742 family protein [Proteobacteria bacterium]|nr:DUF3742 family protein [Pseudomonadota bacterium]
MATNTTYRPAGILTRLAHWLGRAWARTWHKADGALASTGLPPKAVTALIWVAKLAIIAAALYVAFWVALVVVFVILVMNMAANSQSGVARNTRPEIELRDGYQGFGWYCNYLDTRID